MTSLVAEYGLQVAVRLVPSAVNKADALTRVPQRWLKPAAALPDAALPQCGLALPPGLTKAAGSPKFTTCAVTRE